MSSPFGDTKDLVSVTNSLLEELHVNFRVKKVSDIDANVFVTLYEGLCGDTLPNVIRSARSVEDDIHNCNAVVDALSLDILQTSLSHISGEAIVRGDVQSIQHLLEVFDGLLEIMLDKISSDNSSVDENEDHDLVHSSIVDEAVKRGLRSPSDATPERKPTTVEPTSLKSVEQCRQNGEKSPLRRRLSSSLTNNGSTNQSSANVEASPTIRPPTIGQEEDGGSPTRGQSRLSASLREYAYLQNLVDDTARMAQQAISKSPLAKRSHGRNSGSNTPNGVSSQSPLKNRTSPSVLRNAWAQTSEPSCSSGSGDEAERNSATTTSTTAPGPPQRNDVTSSTSLKQPLAGRIYDDRPVHSYDDYLAKYFGIVRNALDAKHEEDKRHDEQKEAAVTKRSGSGVISGGAKPADSSAQESRSSKLESPSTEKPRPTDSEEEWSSLKPKKSVRFDDIISNGAPGRMKGLRRKLKTESSGVSKQSDTLAKLYELELLDLEDKIGERSSKLRCEIRDQDNAYKSQVLRSPKVSKSANNTPTKARPGGRKRTKSPPRAAAAGKRSSSASPSIGRITAQEAVDRNEVLPFLLEEYPYLHLSKETITQLWRKSARQLELITKANRQVAQRRSRAQVQYDEAKRRQQILVQSMKKELAFNDRAKEMKDRQQAVIAVRARLRDKRIQNARARRYYNDYQVRNRSRMLKKRTKEEMVFKKLVQESLDIQRDSIREMRKYARERRDERNERQRNELDSIENYYRDQFAMLAEQMRKQQDDIGQRDKAQSKILLKLRQELRKKMESEIKSFQEQLYRDEDDVYYRELDSDRLKHELRLAKYQSRV